ncbi:hypothetical protein MNBD_GAMMA03-2110 [hydrothermal vent metagenome]|uniref:Uncharacterized protein n=1 Tax=hydrothermal vent metagenome TaxID=652676 RepID=A0A3B0W9C0_9ZZZZ
MPYPIKQIQASYQPIEDRILLTIKNHHQQVYLGWVTRRFFKILLPTLHGQHPITGIAFFTTTSTPTGPQIKTSKPVLKKNRGDVEEYPLGKTPLLFTKLTFQALKSEQASFILAPNTGQGIELPFTPILLNLLLTKLKPALHESDWGLEEKTIYGLPSVRLQ